MVAASPVGASEGSHVRVRPVSDLEGVEPGGTFHLGVVLAPEPGWHVYWRNPGEAGLATELLYDLPDGYRVGEVQWPIPVAFTQPGEIAGYGYENEVLLAAEVTAPDHVESTIPAKLSASWLACKDVCVYGSSEISIRLPLTGSESDEARAAVAGWKELLPKNADPSRLGVTVPGGPVPRIGAAALSVWLNWDREPGAVEFFPVELVAPRQFPPGRPGALRGVAVHVRLR